MEELKKHTIDGVQVYEVSEHFDKINELVRWQKRHMDCRHEGCVKKSGLSYEERSYFTEAEKLKYKNIGLKKKVEELEEKLKGVSKENTDHAEIINRSTDLYLIEVARLKKENASLEEINENIRTAWVAAEKENDRLTEEKIRFVHETNRKSLRLHVELKDLNALVDRKSKVIVDLRVREIELKKEIASLKERYKELGDNLGQTTRWAKQSAKKVVELLEELYGA